MLSMVGRDLARSARTPPPSRRYAPIHLPRTLSLGEQTRTQSGIVSNTATSGGSAAHSGRSRLKMAICGVNRLGSSSEPA